MKQVLSAQRIAARAIMLVCAIAASLAIAPPSSYAADGENSDLGAAAVAESGQDASDASRQAADAAQDEPASDMFRLYNMTSGEHFYTSSEDECRGLWNVGWFYEGIAWVSPDSSAKPVYRVYNPFMGDHHYTMDVAERDSLLQVGWEDEGVGWYSDAKNQVEVYRLYNPNAETGTHHYTYDAAERDQLAQIGWYDEGVAWYAAGDGRQDFLPCNSIHWWLILNSIGSDGSVLPAGAVISDKSVARADEILGSFAGGGYFALNTTTGACIARNADERFFSASTIKAIYAASLCKNSAPGLEDWQGALKNSVAASSNSDYDALVEHFGKSYLTSFAEESGVSLDLPYTKGYADISARDLAKMWTNIADYIIDEGPNVDLFTSLFPFGSLRKVGLMYEDSWTGPLYHVGGITSDGVIYAVMTRNTSAGGLSAAVVDAVLGYDEPLW